ncbi:formate C-acetyltransferase/glycerol dehydratase family glycyl radical enzyme [Flavonifractor sp. DFI.6.63]|uniref:(2S)-3-sulfopropanediol dehydratase n=1 Tax=Flavonifractor sp. DFI.6.63 TaxID=2963704 RepID=UPI00210D8A35|nr:formate C-acetyltransferase/glycerol dehydratase family glycyl radical enzyme [Flavonifractor sp. DFI.6.63]MCQ5029277.1 formate C-acetyltransferase/glycerol dehydratase family glycyl radical enzyme [Flavonifractor sp. DFI.6.63]MDY2976405.1 formate C-acetyltransferase/glycerol dehydratase family glycyl radical enzyme [Oscillospiraceae bacterium]
MKKIYTTACGTEPYDKNYGIGYKVGHSSWTPYPRVERLMKAFFAKPYDIDLQRLRLVTEAYKQHEDCSRKLQCAYAFENVLENVDLEIYDDDLIIGEIAAPGKAAPIYPEFSVKWIIDEVLHYPFEERPHDQYYMRSDEDRRELVELCKYWEGKTVCDYVDSRLDEAQRIGSQSGEKIFQTNLYHYAGVGHYTIDYVRLMKLGYPGIIQEVDEAYARLTKKDPEYDEKRDEYEASLMMLKASQKYLLRYADLAEKKARAEDDTKRKGELKTIAENCRQISAGTPQTFWQALQLFSVATSLLQIESNGHSLSYGRMDQWLYPFYEADMKNGTITKDFAQELLEVQYVRLNNPTKLKDRGTIVVRNGRNWGGECLTIGGVDRAGNDVTNDLTFMFLEASVHTRMERPWLLVRMHEKTPYELKVKTVECIRAGYGHPKLFNDKSAIPSMMRKGCSLEEARDYAVVGCVELAVPGKEYGWHDAAYINTAKMLEMVINGGCTLDGKRLGPDTGSLLTYKNFDEVMESVDKQFDYWLDQVCSTMNTEERAHRYRKPVPYASSLFSSCVESGKDLNEGGAVYNGTGPQASGLGTCADILCTIKQLVFEKKVCAGAELLQAVKDNWEGHEKLYQLVNSSKVHHYGNDDDYADEIFKELFERFCERVSGRKNARGGEFRPGVYSVNANVGMGMFMNASLDGRKKGEAISDNMGAVHTDGGSHDIKGPTALANSVCKVDHSLATNGTLMNFRFPEDAVAGVQGRDNLINFIDEYLERGGMHIQFNIMSSETMRAAQKHPEDYKDMLVRVAGYSAYFVELGKPLQKDLIQRTELHF